MNKLKVIRNCTVVALFLVFIILSVGNTSAQQPQNQQRLPKPLLHKLRGPQWFQQRLLAKKAQAQKKLPTTPKKACPPNCDELLTKARKYGSVSIIVGLNIPDLPDATQFPHAPKEEKRRIDEARKEAIAKAQERLLKRMAKHKITGIKKLQYTSAMGMTVDLLALEDLIANPEVRNIGEDLIMRPLLPQSIPLIGTDQAWAKGFTGAGYTVAILDTGVDSTHPFLTGKIVSEACFSTTDTGINPNDGTSYTITTLCPNGETEQIDPGAGAPCSLSGCEHGTHVAGIAGGQGTTFSGVAKGADIMAIQVFSRFDGTICDPNPSPCLGSMTSDQIRTLDWVYSLYNSYNVIAVNMSLGGGQYAAYCDDDPSYIDLKASIDSLRNAGIATVVASGNEGYIDALSAPACISTAISVGAATKADTVASYSNSASFLNLLAPGGDGSGSSADILSSVPGDQFDYMAGTSMAAPHVAGAWAVLKQQSPTASVSDVLSILESNGVQITDPRNNITKPRINLRNTPWIARYKGRGGNEDISVAIETVAGNTYVTGYSCSDSVCSRYYFVTVKYDSIGNQLWTTIYAGGTSSVATNAVVDSLGNVYVTGYQCNDQYCWDYNYATVKYDTNGNQLWAAVYDGGLYSMPTAIAVDSSENVYVTGYSCKTVNEYYNCLDYSYTTVKYDSAGNLLWVRDYLGFGQALSVDGQGNVYVTGTVCADIWCSTYYNITTVKYDTNGNQLWAASYGGGNSSFSSAIAMDNVGNTYVAGSQCNDQLDSCLYYNLYNFVIIKYNINGDQVWAANYGLGGEAIAITLDSTANVYVTGYICSNFNPSSGKCVDYDYSTVKFDINGNQIWASTHISTVGGDDRATGIAVDIVGNTYIAGYVCKLFDQEEEECKDYDYVTIGYDSKGSQFWKASYRLGNSAPNGPFLAVDILRNVYITGYSCINCYEGDFVTLKYTP